MKRRMSLCGLAACLMSLAIGPGCKVDVPLEPQPQPQRAQERFAGILKDRGGKPLAGKVTINAVSTTATSDGAFELLVPRAEKYVFTAWVAGHLLHSEVYTGKGRDSLSPKLVPAEVFTFDPTQPLEQMDSRGTRIELPAEALVDAQGKPPAGPVSMSMYTYDLLREQMVGDMSALDVNGRPVALISLGAVSVEFSDEAGTAYNLAPGKKATLSLRTLPGHEGEVPLWWYDTAQGLWREEGSARVKDGVATGEVSHFTVWNVDMKFYDSACLQIRVDPQWFSRQGYSFRNPLILEARLSSTWPRYMYLSIEDPAEPHVLYNMEPGTSVELLADGKPLSLVNVNGAWGGTNVPAYPYDACKGTVLLDGTPPSVAILQGQVLRQHRTEHGRTKLDVSVGSSTFSTSTDAAGNFSLVVPVGTATLTASRPGYLSARSDGMVVTASGTLSLPPVTLLAGDVDENACITPADTGLIITALGTSTFWEDPRDLDGDGTIDFPDLALAAGNGNECGPKGW